MVRVTYCTDGEQSAVQMFMTLPPFMTLIDARVLGNPLSLPPTPALIQNLATINNS